MQAEFVRLNSELREQAGIIAALRLRVSEAECLVKELTAQVALSNARLGQQQLQKLADGLNKFA